MGLCDHAGVSLGQLLRMLGDISWELVSKISGTSVYNATRKGRPCYLGFLHIDVRTNGLTLADIKLAHQVTLTSSILADVVPERLTSLVRLSTRADHSPVEFAELASPRDKSIYFQIGMIWIARTEDASNHKMTRSTPDGYSDAHFPPGLASEQEKAMARHESARFEEGASWAGSPDQFIELQRVRVPYVISRSLDLNGVQLVYFASYPHIYQSALTPLCHEMGLEPRHHDEMSLLYFGNADVGDALEVEARLLLEHETGRVFRSTSATLVHANRVIGVCHVKLRA